MNPTQAQLQSLQDCRLYLRAYSLADITSACGHRITKQAWNGTPSINCQPARWINVHKPKQNDWVIWRDFLRRAFLYPHADHRRLRQSLGNWLLPLDQTWNWWVQDDLLYERRPNARVPESPWRAWSRRYTHTNQGNRRRFHNPTACLQPLPSPTLTRAEIELNHAATIASILSTGDHTPATPAPLLNTLEARLKALPPEAAWAASSLNRSDDGESFCEAIANGTAAVVSDGSLKLGFGTAAFILAGGTHEITGVNQVPGPIAEGDSHRCELSGLYGAVVLVNEICSLFNITSGSITIACDNKSAIKCCHRHFVPKPKFHNYDLIQALHQAIINSPVTWLPEHVKGHQDSAPLLRSLTYLEGLNVRMDWLAKAYWRALARSSPTLPTPLHQSLSGEGWQLWEGQHKISGPSTDNLYSIIQTPLTQMWWIRNKFIREAAAPLIDYDATEALFHKIPFNRRRWIVKHSSSNCGVGTTLKAWNFQQDSICPRCGHEKETAGHVIRCHGHGADEVFAASLSTFSKVMEEEDTDPHIVDAISRSLTAFRSQTPIQMRGLPRNIRQAIKDQNKIGWRQFAEGLAAKQWRLLQRRSYRRQGSKKSINKWCVKLLQAVSNIGWKQWEHRNHIKHRVLRPRHKQAIEMLDQEITDRFIEGHTQLLEGDRYHASQNLFRLLQKPVHYKQAWLMNVMAAQKRYMELQAEANEQIKLSRNSSLLVRWIETNQV